MSITAPPHLGGEDLRARLSTLPDSVDLDVHEVRTILGCCAEHVSRLCKRGQFPKPHRLGRIRRWNLGIVRKFLRDRAEAAQANGTN